MLRSLFAAVLAIGLVSPPVAAQTAEVVTAPKFPAPFTVVCDPPPGADVDRAKLTYTLSVDGAEPGPPQPACNFTFSIAGAGSHTARIVARIVQPDGTVKTSQAAVLSFKAELAKAPKPNAGNVKNNPAPAVISPPPTPPVKNAPPPTPPVKSGPAAKPIEAPFTDPDGHQWALVGTDVQMDGKHAPDAGPCTKMVLLNGKVYVFGLNLWWLWSPTASPHWSNAGPELPK